MLARGILLYLRCWLSHSINGHLGHSSEVDCLHLLHCAENIRSQVLIGNLCGNMQLLIARNIEDTDDNMREDCVMWQSLSVQKLQQQRCMNAERICIMWFYFT